MTHLTEDDLVLHHYGEDADPAAVRVHLESCPECRERLEGLRRLLEAAGDLPVPERGEGYGAQVWARLAPRLEAARPRTVSVPAVRRWGGWAAVAACLVAAFLLGRHWPRAGEPGSGPGRVRERILLVAVGDHLERSRIVLVELANAEHDGPVDISQQQRWAEGLLADNRLYRQTAVFQGEAGMADVLDELERVLLEVAHGPSSLSVRELAALQKRIEAKGILFKVRVLGSRVREREKEGRPSGVVS